MDNNTLDKDTMMENFFKWYTHTYKMYPLTLYINLIQLSDWNYFHPENEMKLIDDIYYKEKYSEYFTLEEFTRAIRVMRYYISINTPHSGTEVNTDTTTEVNVLS